MLRFLAHNALFYDNGDTKLKYLLVVDDKRLTLELYWIAVEESFGLTGGNTVKLSFRGF